MNGGEPQGTEPGRLPRSPFGLIDELSCYYDTPAEPNNELFEVRVPGVIDYPTLCQAVAGALAAAPRARGRMAAGSAFRRRYTWEFPPVPDVDPLSCATWSDEQELAAARVAFMASSPPLRISPPIRLLLASGPGASCVMLNAHHAAMDGMSCVELLRDIAARYRGIAGDRAEAAGAPASAEWNHQSLDLAEPQRSWSSSGSPLPLPPPPSRSRGRGPVRAIRRHLVARVAPEGGRRDRRARAGGCGLRLLLLPAVPRLPGATVNDLLVAALIATISRWNGAHRRPPAAIRITVPVNVREPGVRAAAGNHTRIATVSADSRTAENLPLLLAAVTRQTSALRQAGRQRASAGPLGLAPGWCPTPLKRLAVRTALRGLGRIVCDTSMLTNLGNVPDPPWSEPGGRVRMAVAGPARMPRGLTVGAMTADGHLQLSFRYRYALFDETAGARFVAAYAATLDELTAGTHVHEKQALTAKEEIPVVLQQALLTILVCPVDKGSLLYFADEDLLYNPRLRRAYRIERGIPVMLAERAEAVQEDEHERLIARARDGAARMSAAGLARGGFAPDAVGIPYPATASGGIAGPASDGSRSPD